jgi:hypothetical protein
MDLSILAWVALIFILGFAVYHRYSQNSQCKHVETYREAQFHALKELEDSLSADDTEAQELLSKARHALIDYGLRRNEQAREALKQASSELDAHIRTIKTKA